MFSKILTESLFFKKLLVSISSLIETDYLSMTEESFLEEVLSLAGLASFDEVLTCEVLSLEGLLLRDLSLLGDLSLLRVGEGG